MEPFTTYNIPDEPKPDLFVPPSCCRKSDKSKNKADGDEVLPLRFIASNPAKILHLLEKLTDIKSGALEAKINRYLMKEADCSLSLLINLHQSAEEVLIKAVGDEELQTPLRLPLDGEVIQNLVQFENQVLKCGENLHPQIAEILSEVLGERQYELVSSMPILSKRIRLTECVVDTIQPLVLVCLVDSKRDESFQIRLVNELFRYVLTLLLNTQIAEEEARQKVQCQTLLALARKLFSHLEDVNDLLTEIMEEARRLTDSERCSLFLLDPEHMSLVAKVFDGASPNEASTKVRIAKDQGIAGHVATTGEILNIKNAYKHPLFYKGVDEATGFKTRNILCFPIRNETGIIGVAELCNKYNGNFNHFDEELAKGFSIYCGLSIMHSLIYKETQVAKTRIKLSNELMMYHMKVSDDDVLQKLNCKAFHYHPHLDNWDFSPRLILEKETVCFALKMFEDLGFSKHFNVKREMVTKFLMFVEKGYRDTPYHNWTHAFSVCHFAYLCLKNLQLVEKGYITKLEALALFISCLCHDLDHRGTNNSFQKQSNNTLASLYSSQGSVMERHHFAQAICTLNTEGCNILESLEGRDYGICLDLIRDMILATDLASHFSIYRKQYKMIHNGYKRNNAEHRYAFVCLLMTCADLSDQTKKWDVAKKVAEGIYEEFFTQGDLERKMGKQPSEMMDRTKAPVPDLQVDFLNTVCLPVYKLLARMFPELKELVTAVKKNILCWESSRCIFEKGFHDGLTALEVLKNPEFEGDVQAIIDLVENKKKEEVEAEAPMEEKTENIEVGPVE